MALVVIALAALAFAILLATGFIRFQVDGALEAPRVEVTGGAVPEISMETGRIAVDTEPRVVEVPTVEVKRATDAD